MSPDNHHRGDTKAVLQKACRAGCYSKSNDSLVKITGVEMLLSLFHFLDLGIDNQSLSLNYDQSHSSSSQCPDSSFS